MKNKIIILMLLLSTISFAQSSEVKNNKTKKIDHSIGLSAGFTSGFGLSYKLKHKRLTHQISLLPFTINGYKIIDYAYTLHFTLKENKFVDCNVYAGINRFNSNTKNAFEKDDFTGNIVTIIGTGLNFNFHLGSNFSIIAGGGLANYHLYENFLNLNGIAATIDAGLFYKL
ncbi:MAG: hypothetical protein ACO3EE_11565 [Flavobacteriales bacterium]